jgi:hypothetical protein
MSRIRETTDAEAIADVDNYSRIGVNRLRGRDDEAITQDEVSKEIRKLLTMKGDHHHMIDRNRGY